MERVTILVCCFNGADRLPAALDSALGQSLSQDQFGVLVVDDGSTDATPTVIEEYMESYPNLRGVRNQENLGLVAACNRGLTEIQTDYIIRLDHDDTFDPAILDSMMPPLNEDLSDLVYSDRYEALIDEDSVEYISLDNFNLFKMTAAGVLMRRNFLLDLGGYREFFWEEYDLYLRYARKSGRPFYRIPQALYRYTRRPGSLTMTASSDNMRRGWEELLENWGEETLRGYGWDPMVRKT